MNKQKAKMKQSKILKGSSGITLIALVITIIVLLILAGVSIATLTGDNGILNQADRARIETEKAEVIERARIDILEYQADNKSGKVTTKQLKDVLSKYFKSVPEEDELLNKLKEEDFKLKSKPEYGGQEIEIADIYDGSLTQEAGGTTAIASEVNAKIGQTVEYEVSNQASEELKQAIGGWRVFYASDAEMFLISSNTIASETAFGVENTFIPLKPKGTEGNYDDGAKEEVFQAGYGFSYNKKWLETSTTDKETRSKATAYLCDPANWTEYVGDNAPDGTYAVGGPTKELFIKSWNASIPKTNVKKVELETEDVTAEGYAYDKPSYLNADGDKPILKTILPDALNDENGLYNNGHPYWLASPSSHVVGGVCAVAGDGCLAASWYYSTTQGVRPLVSIPISSVQIEDGMVTIGNN